MVSVSVSVTVSITALVSAYVSDLVYRPVSVSVLVLGGVNCPFARNFGQAHVRDPRKRARAPVGVGPIFKIGSKYIKKCLKKRAQAKNEFALKGPKISILH